LLPSPVGVTPPAPLLPEIAPADGPLRLTVVYPTENSLLTATDSNFIFGATGSGRATLTINDVPVPVAPNGAYLAFLSVPPDSVYRLQAIKDGETVTLERRVRLQSSFGLADSAVIARETIFPTGSIALPRGELLEVGFVGAAGGHATLITPMGSRHELTEQPVIGRGSTDAANFRDSSGAITAVTGVSRYSALVPVEDEWAAPDSSISRPLLAADQPRNLGLPFGFFMQRDSAMDRRARERGLPLPTPAESASVERYMRNLQQSLDSLSFLTMKYSYLRRDFAVLEFVLGPDTTRLPLNAYVVPIDAHPPRTAIVTPPPDAPSDWQTRGRPGLAGPFHWFWPPGTQLAIDGERAGQYRVRLSGELSAWIPASDVQLLPRNSPTPRASVAGVRFVAYTDRVDIRIAVPARLPFRIDETERSITVTVYGATSEVNFLQYGSLDPLIERAAWSQPASDQFVMQVALTQPVWGYSTRFDESGALIVSLRRPPVMENTRRPLSGLLIAIDPGHPPTGAVGPTGLTEARANLEVALQLKPLLEAAGARVLMTRVDDSPVELGARPRLATEMNAHILLSIHNNAFPDGVNPFENNGSSVYYFHRHSLDLARAVLTELLRELRLRDIGMGRADLAIGRTTWMPAVLSETMFLMVPQQEAALRDPAVQRRIAEAHVRALESFVRSRAAATVSRN
jgi:N-acetylmuramoyl-L-alanine amidase